MLLGGGVEAVQQGHQEAASHPGVYPRGPATALEFLHDRPS